MRIHLVAIGGSVMHHLALDLSAAGHTVSGSDDELYEPSLSRLREAGLLPESTGWFPENIDSSLDCVIAGMHAKPGNPEIERALELGIQVYSFPEFYGTHCREKLRIVVAGSHGKTTTTAMIMHALQKSEKDFDYLVGASLPGFERSVRLSNASVCVIEGDEYPSSPLDLRPKIMHYDPDIAIITGIAWDHMNVFPTWESYVNVFRDFISGMRDEAILIWYGGHDVLRDLVNQHGRHLRTMEYREIREENPENQESTILDPAVSMGLPGHSRQSNGLKIFGRHNMQNLAAAALACAQTGISSTDFLTVMQDFTGAAMRLQLLHADDRLVVYRDFAHAPSKVKATVQAVREQYPDRFLVACVELHTFSSLNATFLPQYYGALDNADHVMIFYSPKTLEIKKMPPISITQITDAFAHQSLEVMTSVNMLAERLSFFSQARECTALLMMSSGRFEGLDVETIIHPQQKVNAE